MERFEATTRCVTDETTREHAGVTKWILPHPSRGIAGVEERASIASRGRLDGEAVQRIDPRWRGVGLTSRSVRDARRETRRRWLDRLTVSENALRFFSLAQRKDWLALVAVHSDAWLMAVAFYYGAKFDAKKRCVVDGLWLVEFIEARINPDWLAKARSGAERSTTTRLTVCVFPVSFIGFSLAAAQRSALLQD
jgi:hypothetical protein